MKSAATNDDSTAQFKEGEQAAANGAAKEANPYAALTMAWVEWRDGWETETNNRKAD